MVDYRKDNFSFHVPRTDWHDPGSRLEYVKEYKRRKRWEKIRASAPKLRCPVCGEGPIVESSRWVLGPEGAVCRSCHLKRRSAER